jgi:hypothetical protein
VSIDGRAVIARKSARLLGIQPNYLKPFMNPGGAEGMLPSPMTFPNNIKESLT